MGRAGDEHLPAGLHAEARVDEELGELAIPGICHRANIRRTYCFVKYEPCPRSARPRSRPPASACSTGARRCFARHGYEGATVVRLEEEIGLSRGAIFNWFPSKQELFLALAAEDNERFHALFADGRLRGAAARR